MRTFRTPKGTELPILDLRGKDYMQVAQRLVWFREDNPDWAIETEPVTIMEAYSIFRAKIFDRRGKLISIGHKREDQKHFPDYIEKAETGAIGRALAHCGYGTQFAPELDEGDRLADAPVQKLKKDSEVAARFFEALPPDNGIPNSESAPGGQDGEKVRLGRLIFTSTFEDLKGKAFSEIVFGDKESTRKVVNFVNRLSKENKMIGTNLKQFKRYVELIGI